MRKFFGESIFATDDQRNSWYRTSKYSVLVVDSILIFSTFYWVKTKLLNHDEHFGVCCIKNVYLLLALVRFDWFVSMFGFCVGGSGQQMICFRLYDPHSAGYNECSIISFITVGQSSKYRHVPAAPDRATWHVSPKFPSPLIKTNSRHFASKTSAEILFILVSL